MSRIPQYEVGEPVLTDLHCHTRKGNLGKPGIPDGKPGQPSGMG